jgi:hypothetical protein
VKPVRTAGTNVDLTMPGDTTGERTLPATRAMLYDTENGETQQDAHVGFITVWQPDEAEARALEAGALVELCIWGSGHPPVAVGVTSGIVPERELIDRGHVDRALGLLYARLKDRLQGLRDQPLHTAGMSPEQRHNATHRRALDIMDNSLPEAGAFVDLWVECVTDTRPAPPTEAEIRLGKLIDGDLTQADLAKADAAEAIANTRAEVDQRIADELGVAIETDDFLSTEPKRRVEPSTLDTDDASREDPGQ